jgi:diguanylate cyclase (GGDEF)-like protein/PAS domain S-box-containing protein
MLVGVLARCLWAGFVLAVAIPAAALEREFFFDRLDNERGLLQNSIQALAQTRDGTMWIGTQAALHQFDGYRFKIYEHDPDDPNSLPDSVISALAEDDSGRLWVSTKASGVARFDPRTGRFESFALPVEAVARNDREALSALAFDGSSGLWLGGRSGLERLDPATGVRQRVLQNNEANPIGEVRGIVIAGEQTIWAVGNRGVWRVSAAADRIERVAASLPEDLYSIHESRDHSILVGSKQGLYRIDPSRGESSLIWANDGASPIVAIAEDGVGKVWMSVRGRGLVNLDPRSGQERWIRSGRTLIGYPPPSEVTTLLVDQSGLLWVGSEALGLSRADPLGATFHLVVDNDRSRDQGSTNNIRAILEDRAGRIWLGTDGDGLKSFSRNAGEFEYHDAAIARAFEIALPARIRIEALAEAGDGKIWFAGNLGIGSLDPRTGRVAASPTGLGSGVDDPERGRRSLIIARDGGIWYSGRSTGVVRYDPRDGSRRSWRHRDGDASSLTHDRVLALYEDRQGRIWAGTVDGLNIIDPASDRVRTVKFVPGDPHSLSGNIVRSIHESEDGTFWIGTHSGLNRLTDADAALLRFDRILKRDGLLDATIYGILEDPMGRLWLSSNRGIASYDRNSGAVHGFSVKDGLQGQEFNGGAVSVLRSGEFAFGGINGLNLVKPGAAAASRFIAPVVVNEVRIGNAEAVGVLAGQPLRMEQVDRVVHFSFAALDYAAPEQNRFRYRLEGFDDDWVDAGTSHEATYTNLDAGFYRFRVLASNRDGHWNEAGASVDLEVRPAWWNTRAMRMAYAGLGLLAALASWWAMRRQRQVQRRHKRELEEREQRLRLALWGSSDEFWDLNMDSGVLVRLSAARTQARQREEINSVYDWVREHVHADDQRAIAQHLDDHINNKAALFESEQRVLIGKDKWIWVLARGKIVERDEQGRPLRICGTARNITASREAERERRIVQEVISSMREAVTVCDLEFKFVSVNPAFTRITGWQKHEVVGRSVSLLNCAQHSPEYYQNLRDSVMREGLWRGELWQRRKDGEEFLCWLQSSEVRDAHGQRTHYIGVLTDITERKRTEQELRYLANYDTLTGLPNRTLLSERLGHAVIRARRGARKVAVLFLDLDRFKHVNDSMGHAAGDRMLKAAGSRLRDNVRDGDTVARIGGDEFTVVLEELADAGEAERVAMKLITAFEKPLELNDGQDVVISPSIGISLYPDHAQTPTDLLKFADTAMYQAKDRGRKTYMVYTETMDAAARMRATLVGALRKALERGEFSLVYQPKLALLDERITGVEALLRWNSQDLGEISPVTFIPVAEESGMIIEIGDWVLVRACEQLSKWHRDGLRDISMSVNISVLQLQRGDLTQRLCDILAENDMAPNQLELELTESVIMANAEQSISTLRQLKAVGVTLSIDDFGTGYSSLSYLRRLPIDALKIDKEFVGDITTDPDDEAITATVINMAHSLGLNVVAEGVETAEQAEYLREQGCDEIQGHWLSTPLPPEQCFVFLRERARRRQEVLDDNE